MSSRDLFRLARIPVACLAVSMALAGCFRPLYGPTASGQKLEDVLAAVDVEMPSTPAGQERIGHYLRSELIFDLDGSGRPAPKRYKLTLDTAETIQPVSVDTLTGRADQAMLNGTARFSLKDLEGRTVFAGTARANATYQRDEQRFASVRAARDADIRVAKLLADDIKQRLAAHFASAR
jgi:LPS-assembly lipoprotein